MMSTSYKKVILIMIGLLYGVGCRATVDSATLHTLSSIRDSFTSSASRKPNQGEVLFSTSDMRYNMSSFALTNTAPQITISANNVVLDFGNQSVSGVSFVFTSS